MAWLSGYRFRKKIGITGQAGAGTDYQVPLTVHSGKWTSPTSFDDPDSAWNTETLIYDGNTTTSGYTFTHDHYLELILDSAIDTDTVRIYGQIVDLTPPGAYYDIEVDIDLFYGADWHNIFSGTIAKNTWVEKTNPAGIKSVTKARIKSNNASYTTRIYEFEFEARAGAGKVWLWDYCTDFPNDIRFTDDDGETELDHWCEDLTADPAKFWIEVADDLDSNQDIYIYFGKSRASTASNGANTFIQYHGAATAKFLDALLSLGTQIRYRAKVMVLESTVNLWFGFSSTQDTNANQIRIQPYTDSGQNQKYFRTFKNSAMTSMNEAPCPTVDTWAILDILYDTTSAHGYVDDDEIGAGSTTNLPTVDMGLFFRQGDAGDAKQDWSFIGKYVSPEPSVGTPGNQEVNPVIIMHHRKMLEEE